MRNSYSSLLLRSAISRNVQVALKVRPYGYSSSLKQKLFIFPKKTNKLSCVYVPIANREANNVYSSFSYKYFYKKFESFEQKSACVDVFKSIDIFPNFVRSDNINLSTIYRKRELFYKRRGRTFLYGRYGFLHNFSVKTQYYKLRSLYFQKYKRVITSRAVCMFKRDRFLKLRYYGKKSLFRLIRSFSYRLRRRYFSRNLNKTFMTKLKKHKKKTRKTFSKVNRKSYAQNNKKKKKSVYLSSERSKLSALGRKLISKFIFFNDFKSSLIFGENYVSKIPIKIINKSLFYDSKVYSRFCLLKKFKFFQRFKKNIYLRSTKKSFYKKFLFTKFSVLSSERSFKKTKKTVIKHDKLNPKSFLSQLLHNIFLRIRNFNLRSNFCKTGSGITRDSFFQLLRSFFLFSRSYISSVSSHSVKLDISVLLKYWFSHILFKLKIRNFNNNIFLPRIAKLKIRNIKRFSFLQSINKRIFAKLFYMSTFFNIFLRSSVFPRDTQLFYKIRKNYIFMLFSKALHGHFFNVYSFFCARTTYLGFTSHLDSNYYERYSGSLSSRISGFIGRSSKFRLSSI